jgi:hypothetical protein
VEALSPSPSSSGGGCLWRNDDACSYVAEANGLRDGCDLVTLNRTIRLEYKPSDRIADFLVVIARESQLLWWLAFPGEPAGADRRWLS